jgi:hypothetical protein
MKVAWFRLGQRRDDYRCPVLAQPQDGIKQLDVFKLMGNQDRDALARKSRHGYTSSSVQLSIISDEC